MPSTSGIFTLWRVASPNGASYNMQFDVTFGKEGDEFSGTYSTPSDGKAFQFEFDLSGFNVNDTLTFRVDNVSGNNSWHNIGFYCAGFAIPEPTTASLLGLVGAIAFMVRRHFCS